MTAKDELALNIPDALMNGQAIVDVIQNCVPSIKNAWQAPTIDLDALLIAIRIATYGEMMKTPITLNDDIEMDYQVDLRSVLDGIMSRTTWEHTVPVSAEMTVFVRPLTYKQASSAALNSFETQKIIQLTNNDQLSEDDKVKMFKESFAKLSESTMNTVINSIFRIDTSNGSTDNPQFIREFIENTDKDTFNIIEEHLNKLKETNSIKPMIVPVTDEMRAQGIQGDTIEIPLVFDASTFFA
jgi:hypothetical protein